MSGEDAAYATLGLSPGAPLAEVDEAYRRLIKLYHPDRTGGDGSRAAEINRAYTLIRRQSPQRPPARRSVPVPVQPRREPRRGRRAGWMMAFLVLVAGGFAVANDIPTQSATEWSYSDPFELTAPAERQSNSAAVAPVSFEEPLQTEVIDRAVADAVKFHAAGDQQAIAEFSRACHNRLRDEPSLTWFDSCAAFDEAMVTLSGNPFDSGPFNASSVMAREMGAAKHLSHDMLAADSRLHHIRSRVELALVPRLDEAASEGL